MYVLYAGNAIYVSLVHIGTVFFLGGISRDEKMRRLTFAPNIFSAQHHAPHISRHFEEAPNTTVRA